MPAVFGRSLRWPGRRAATISVWLAIVAVTLVGACVPRQTPSTKPVFTSFLGDTNWLAKNRAVEGLVVVDLRPANDYRQGHIPGAVNLALVRITDASNPVIGMVAQKAQMEGAMRSLGINQESMVLIYDEGNTPNPGRLFWALHYYGLDRIAILDGGYAEWRKEGLATDTETLSPAAGNFVANPHPSRIADKRYVKASIGKPGVVLLDVRSPGEYSGSVKYSQRGGHVPGAVNIEWFSNLVTVGGVARMRPADELSRLYEGLGVTTDKEVVVYCQTGVRGAQTYFTLKYLGYGNVRLYDGSWEEWGNDPALPVETDKSPPSTPIK